MAIHFESERWERVRTAYRQWWAGTLDRPLIAVRLLGYGADGPEPELPIQSFASSYAMDVPTTSILDRWEWELSAFRYMGDGFPCTGVNCGPGVIAAFLGCQLIPGEETAWFVPEQEREIADIHFTFDPDAPWFQRIVDLKRASIERWQGAAQLGMTDLGGNLDILSSFRPSEKLLFDLYDHPDEVKRLTWEAHEAWWSYFEAFNDVMQPQNPGYSAWTTLFSEDPYYMLQCDFCYMLGPDMFDEFVRPELAASCRRLSNPFYHLDGPGQLPHLDSLLSIPELKGIQWIPGAGQPDETHWPEVYQKIRDAGKRIQLFGRPDAGNWRMLDALVDQLGSGKDIAILVTAHRSEEDELRDFLAKYGVDA